MNKLDEQYLNILTDILNHGHKKTSRTGVDTLSLFRREIRHNMSEGFPLLTTKKVAFKLAIQELMWFLSGSTNLQSLVSKGNYIWVGDAYKRYNTAWKIESDNSSTRHGKSLLWDLHMLKDMTREEFIEEIKTNNKFAKMWGELGPIYGHQWRNWGGDGTLTKIDVGPITNHNKAMKAINYTQDDDLEKAAELGAIITETTRKGVDQIEALLDKLKNDPDSRRMLVNAWNVSQLEHMTLPPCHYAFEVYTRELTDQERKDIFASSVKFPDMIIDQFSTDEELMAFFDNRFIPKREISLAWTQRSADFPLGVPFNLVCYGALLLMLADECNMVPGELVGTFTDCHIYENQLEGVEEQIERTPYKLPKVSVEDGIYSSPEDFYFETPYKHHPHIKFPLSN